MGKVRYGAASQAMVKLTLVAAREVSRKNLPFTYGIMAGAETTVMAKQAQDKYKPSKE